MHFDGISKDVGFADLMYQLLKAREVLPRMHTLRAAGPVASATVSCPTSLWPTFWTTNFESSGETTFLPTENTLDRQFDGLHWFVNAMHRPCEDEVRNILYQLQSADRARK